MFCPKCRDEFIEGITECPDCKCKVPLVYELSVEEGPTHEPIYVDLVTIFESGDPDLITKLRGSGLEISLFTNMLSAFSK